MDKNCYLYAIVGFGAGFWLNHYMMVNYSNSSPYSQDNSNNEIKGIVNKQKRIYANKGYQGPIRPSDSYLDSKSAPANPVFSSNPIP